MTHLVSCVMPTRDRRAFVPLAIECFLAQDHAERELVVVDDGADPVEDLIPPDPRISYERLDRTLVLGAKRNLACGRARGELIAHWDDDDWSSPRRLSAQVAALAGSDAQIVGLDELYFFDPLARRAWRYVYPERASRPWVAGGTLCYRRSFWEANPFPEIRVGEDSRFVWARGARVRALGDPSLYAATVHASNTSVKRPRPPRWQPAPAADVAALLGAQEPAYRAAADGAAPAGAARPQPAPAAAHTHVTVTIPYHRCRAHIRQCVDSVLAQTHRDLTAVVVCDGDPDPPWDLLDDIDDPRLVCFDLPRNRGRYFADQVVLQATKSPYLLVHDADDWSEPHRLATLLRTLRVEHANGAISAAKGRSRIVEVSRLLRPPAERFEHLAKLHGLFRADALRAVGGFYAGFIVGYDTFLVNALAMTGRITPVAEPLYTWRRRPDSLTQAPETGLRSALRRETTAHLRDMHRSAYAAYARYIDGELEVTDVAEAIRRLGAARIDPQRRKELDEHARRLTDALEGRAPKRPGRRSALRAAPARPATPQRALPALLDEAAASADEYAIGCVVAVELAARLDRLRPRRVLELGSGLSTAVLADYAQRSGASVITLEHDARFAARTRAMLARRGLAGAVDLRVAPLLPWRCADGEFRPWYDLEPNGGFDFVLVDGPPVAHGRGAALFALYDRLASPWELWLDDALRDHEQQCLALWRRHLPVSVTQRGLDAKGLAILAPQGAPVPSGPEPALAGLAIGIVAGGRSPLLRATVERLIEHAGAALDAAHVVVLLEGTDRERVRFVRGLSFVDRLLVPPRPHGAGHAMSTLMADLAKVPGVDVILHLPGEWAASTVAGGWLRRSADLLLGDHGVGQVRLRHRSEPVLDCHMVTGRPIVWAEEEEFLRSPSAHFTFGPGMIRAADVPVIFPCADEREAQARFLRAGLATAQSSPGVFCRLREGVTPPGRSRARRGSRVARQRRG